MYRITIYKGEMEVKLDYYTYLISKIEAIEALD